MPLCHCEALACTARSTAMRSESFVLRRSQHAEPKAERRAAERLLRGMRRPMWHKSGGLLRQATRYALSYTYVEHLPPGYLSYSAVYSGTGHQCVVGARFRVTRALYGDAGMRRSTMPSTSRLYVSCASCALIDAQT
jgi:hypothetical protein